MDNPLIAAGAALATLLLILINWLIGGWRAIRIETAMQACERYRKDFPDDRISDAALDIQGRAALLSLDGTKAIGLVMPLGDRMVTRRMEPGDLQYAAWNGDSLHLRQRDFVLPPVRLDLDVATAASWRERLGQTVGKGTVHDAA